MDEKTRSDKLLGYYDWEKTKHKIKTDEEKYAWRVGKELVKDMVIKEELNSVIHYCVMSYKTPQMKGE